MIHAHRLFDCLDLQMQQGGSDAMLVGKENDEWRKYSTAEVNTIVNNLCSGLAAMGVSCGDMSVEGRDKIAIISKNRPEWMMIDLAVQKMGAILVPIYPTAHVNDIEFIFKDAQVKFVFVNDQELFDKVQQVKHATPSVIDVFSFEKINNCRHWTDVATLGKEQPHHLEETCKRINTEDLFTIIYTSGTTGTPKGVMLSHHNVLSNVMTCLPYLPVEKGSRSISFLPLNHIFERMVTYVYLYAGVSIYYAESMETLGDNLREVKPQIFSTVPRLLEKVYEKIMAKAAELTGIKNKLFFWALDLGMKYDVQQKGSAGYRFQLDIARKLVFKKWREALGNELECIITGAAACPVKLLRVFTAAGIPILEGYGQTESSPVISVNRMDDENRKFGTVGPIIDGVEVKLAEDGEILCKGPNVMMGYYKRPDLTAETVIDGWLYTGDIGTLVEGKFLKITDRKKEIFKTSGGKFVAPQPIENKLVESSYIEQVMVVGANQKFAGALIVPSFANLQEWCKKNGIQTTDNKELVQHQMVKKLFKDVIEEMNKNFNSFEQVKKFELLPKEWAIDSGELTPTLKLKRKVIMEKHGHAVNKIYNES